eukprot:4961064-Amphidinium_carterae.1
MAACCFALRSPVFWPLLLSLKSPKKRKADDFKCLRNDCNMFAQRANKWMGISLKPLVYLLTSSVSSHQSPRSKIVTKHGAGKFSCGNAAIQACQGRQAFGTPVAGHSASL